MPAALSFAIAAHQRGDWKEAERLYQEILTQDPSQADAAALLGVVLGTRGAFEEGLAWGKHAIELDPHSGILRFHYGTVLMAAQRLPEALETLQKAVLLQPTLPQISYNLANALRAADRWDDAIAAYREVLRLDPSFVPAHNNLALSLVRRKDYETALSHAQQAIALDPTYAEGWITLCNVAEKLKQYDRALEAGIHACTLAPESAYAWFGRGVALNRLDRDVEAITCYERSLMLRPQDADTLDNLAQSYQSLNRLEEAEALFRQTVVAAGQVILDEEGGEIDETAYGNREWHLALIELLRGKYTQGFARYRARVKAIPELRRPSYPFPLWKGESLQDKTILVCDEQGFGDTLMLARFLPVLKERGARLVFSVHPVLAPLFEGWQAVDQVVTHGTSVKTGDVFCSSFDLPHRLGVTLDTVPQQVPYLPLLPPDAATRLPAEGFKIGVVWGGSPLHKSDAKRSVPLSVFARLFEIRGALFYNLNRDLKHGDAEILPAYPVQNLLPLLTDFAQAARLIGQMDLVLTCDTATAHLAGALGKKVWILLPFAPDWRWLTDRADSPWYPTARLFRQPAPGDWGSVMTEVEEALRQEVAPYLSCGKPVLSAISRGP